MRGSVMMNKAVKDVLENFEEITGETVEEILEVNIALHLCNVTFDQTKMLGIYPKIRKHVEDKHDFSPKLSAGFMGWLMERIYKIYVKDKIKGNK